LKNQWGVYDEFLFDHIYKKLSTETGRPKFIYAMSTSNHPPYSLPPTYTPLPLKVSGELEKQIVGNKELAKRRFMLYQYANQRLGELLTRIKESKYGGNTIIAVTGDHNFWNVFAYGTERYPDLYGVPFYLYVPDRLKPRHGDTSVTGSHIDIMPTLYNLSLSSREYVGVGTNLFDKAAPHIGFNSDGFIFSEYGAIKRSPKDASDSFYAWQDYASKRLISTPENVNLEKGLTYYKAALAVTDYYLKHAVSIMDPKTR
jgi:phosphoglycerol transferase MdoB-like AlkP superfamily enzyme